MYKLSNYIVSKEFFDAKDNLEKVLIFSTRQSKLIVLDKLSWNRLKRHDAADLKASLVEKLVSTNILVPKNENELNSIIRENQNFIDNSQTLYQVIQNTAWCPLGCGYCGQLHAPKQMDLKTQLAVVKRIRSKLKNGSFKTLVIGWFGAEPLSGMPVIDSLTSMLTKLASEFGVKYEAKVVTNALAMTPVNAKKLVEQYHVKSIEVTLDGSAEYHDKRRHTKTNQPTFETIYKNVYDLAFRDDLEVSLSIRCNVDKRNRKGVKPLLHRMATDDLHRKISYFYVAPIHSWGNDAHTLSEEKEEFAKLEIDWLLEMKQLGFNLPGLPARKKSTCIAVEKNSELVDPNGHVFNCTEVSLVPSYEKEGRNVHSLGHVHDKKLVHIGRRRHFGDFYEEVLAKKWPCSSCNILPVCGGMCPKEWKEGRVACPSFKHNVQDKMLLTYLSVKEKEAKQELTHKVGGKDEMDNKNNAVDNNVVSYASV